MPNNFRIQEIESPQIWESFIQKQKSTVFVQSPQYGAFYKTLGENFFILGILKDGELVGGSLVVTTHARRGNFLYLPYGPFLPAEHTSEALKVFTDYLKTYAKKNNYSFIRVSPFLEENSENIALFKSCKYRSAPMHVLAETTWILDIRASEEILLKNMNKNHRNLIRRCEREAVVITQSRDPKDLEGLDQMLEVTARRHNFTKFSRTYIASEFKSFLPDNTVLFEARLPDGRLDGAAIIMFYGNMACYRHSASLGLDNKLPTSYLLQWEVIKEAKKRGLYWYHFWGIAPTGANKKHPFFGITHFKKGFGGEIRNILHCQDFVVSKKYYFNWIIEQFRKRKRGF
ncbi:MAG: peptidoglycan bridge formation glycyltransferase FemA/FemB family protein [Candidatus Magasanikbacteria bacterium]